MFSSNGGLMTEVRKRAAVLMLLLAAEGVLLCQVSAGLIILAGC